MSQAAESSPQLYSEPEHESVIGTHNASQEKEIPHQSYSQQKNEDVKKISSVIHYLICDYIIARIKWFIYPSTGRRKFYTKLCVRRRKSTQIRQ